MAMWNKTVLSIVQQGAEKEWFLEKKKKRPIHFD